MPPLFVLVGAAPEPEREPLDELVAFFALGWIAIGVGGFAPPLPPLFSARGP